MNKLRYIAYVRKSSEDEERQVLSKEAQKDKIKERFGDLKIIVTLEESKSAFEPDKRDIFKKMLDMLDAGEADGIVAWHPDRLSRNAIDAAAISHRISRNVIKDLKFASFSFDNSPEGIMMLQMTMSQSQYFSAKLSKDIRRGNERKRKMGGITGPAPEGYLNDQLKKTTYKDPERFPLIRQAFDLYLTGEYSVQSILKIMNEDWGYKTVKRHKIGGTGFSRSSLYKVFRNVRYSGWIPDPYNPDKFYRADFPAMITEAEYDKVQVLLGRRGLPRLATRKQFALRGFIRCGECGCMITAQSKEKILKDGKPKVHTYYHCTGKRAGCTQKSIYVKEDDLWGQLLDRLDKYELVPKLFDWAIEAFRDLAEQEVADRNNVQIMQNKTIVSVQEQLDRLLDLATRGLISDTEYKTKAETLKTDLKKLQAEQSDTAHRVRNWYDFATATFEKLTYANNKFVKGDIVTKKDILLATGQNPVLLDGKLQITSYVWLQPIEKAVKPMRGELEKVRMLPEQIQKASLEALRIQWCRV